jgi:glyoxylase-like metal-dependent hydrolase (beta-lactamase superfamily II)
VRKAGARDRRRRPPDVGLATTRRPLRDFGLARRIVENGGERVTGVVDGAALIAEEAPGVVRIDHRWMGTPGLIASYLLGDGDDLALVEAGPASTADNLLAGIRAAGHDPAAVRTILLTHIHLDHAAGTGLLLRHMPRARVVVHPAGAGHLADPSRLLRSAARIYCDRMDALWGVMLPVPADRIDARSDALVRAAGRTLTAMDTPGHAGHHLAFHNAGAGLVFTGDVAGVRLPGCTHVRPPTPPPEFDPELWRASIARLRGTGAERLLLTHFGGFGDAPRHLDELQARLDEWTAWARAGAGRGWDRDELIARLRDSGDAAIRHAGGDDATVLRYEASVPYAMMADGILRWLERSRG